VELVAWAVLVGLAASAAATGLTTVSPAVETASVAGTGRTIACLVAIEAAGNTIPNIAVVPPTAIGPRQIDSAAPRAVIRSPNVNRVLASRLAARGEISPAVAATEVD
jgi:hypothetical protein